MTVHRARIGGDVVRPRSGLPVGCGVVIALVVLVAASCAPSAGVADPADRALQIVTTACGHAGATTGSGLVWAAGQALTAAHVVAGATDVAIIWDGGERPAQVEAYDTRRDLALLAFEPTAADARVDQPDRRDLAVGEAGIIIGAVVSGDVEFTVAETTVIETDEVRGTRRVRRRGYRLDATTAPGDSGAGLFDGDDRLTGLLFAVSTDDDRRSWAVSATEIDTFLADPTVRRAVACDPQRSKLVPVEG